MNFTYQGKMENVFKFLTMGDVLMILDYVRIGSMELIIFVFYF